LSKRDKSVICIQRLSNLMPWQRLEGHVRTSNARVISAAILAWQRS
jgi:hypothetical protein